MISYEQAEHFLWGEVCDGWHLGQTPELAVIEERMPPGAREQRRVHGKARQFFYVLAGEVVLEADGALSFARRAGHGDCARHHPWH